eukprot:COSAG06_NODE_38439_length_423_cov_1.740741_1_plen_20_part_01
MNQHCYDAGCVQNWWSGADG